MENKIPYSSESEKELQKYTSDIMCVYAMKRERAIKGILVDHYGPEILSVSGMEAFQRVADDGLIITQQAHKDLSLEIVLYRGPQTPIGEKLDESRVIARKIV